MDWWDIIIKLASAIVLIIQGLGLWVLWSLRKQFVARDHCNAQCQELAKKQTELEQAQKALPDAAMVNTIRERLGSIEGSVKAVEATIKGQADTMQRIERPLNLLLEHHLRPRGSGK